MESLFKGMVPFVLIVVCSNPVLVWGKPINPELEEKIKKYNNAEREGRRLFNSYVQELEARTSPLSPRDEEKFLRDSVKLKIYKDSSSAKEALSALKGRLSTKLAELERKIGFTQSPNLDLKPPENSGPIRNAIGFSNEASPRPSPSLPSNDKLLRDPQKVGFKPAAETEGPAPAPSLPNYINSMKLELKTLAINVDPTALQAELANGQTNRPIHEMVKRLFKVLPSENRPRLYVLSEGHTPTPPESLKYSTMTTKELSSEFSIGEVFEKTIQWIGKAKNVTFRIPLEGLTPENIETIFNTAKGEKVPGATNAKSIAAMLGTLAIATGTEAFAHYVDQNRSVTEASVPLDEKLVGMWLGDAGKSLYKPASTQKLEKGAK